jgi:hypothetical protein
MKHRRCLRLRRIGAYALGPFQSPAAGQPFNILAEKVGSADTVGLIDVWLSVDALSRCPSRLSSERAVANGIKATKEELLPTNQAADVAVDLRRFKAHAIETRAPVLVIEQPLLVRHSLCLQRDQLLPPGTHLRRELVAKRRETLVATALASHGHRSHATSAEPVVDRG